MQTDKDFLDQLKARKELGYVMIECKRCNGVGECLDYPDTPHAKLLRKPLGEAAFECAACRGKGYNWIKPKESSIGAPDMVVASEGPVENNDVY